MRKTMLLFGIAAALGACGQSTDESANQAAAKTVAAAKKPRPAYCFFTDSETKGWALSRDRNGNIVVKGKAYREDSRYKAVLNPAIVSGIAAEIAPTIVVNDTGFAARDNWWDLKATIPNSGAIDAVTVRCGSRTIAQLQAPPRV
jgi:hypothetical protein